MTAPLRHAPTPIAFGPPRPIWAAYYDRVTDLSDAHGECCDPQNEVGALVTGFFTARLIDAMDDQMRAGFNTGFDLDGIAVETLDGTTYHDRAEVLRMWGADAVWRVEACEMEAAL
jgi:hypothetical protein